MEEIAERATARLNPVEAVMERLGVGRSMVFGLIAAEEAEPGTGLRSVKVGRRRLVPESAIVEFIRKLDNGGDAA